MGAGLIVRKSCAKHGRAGRAHEDTHTRDTLPLHTPPTSTWCFHVPYAHRRVTSLSNPVREVMGSRFAPAPTCSSVVCPSIDLETLRTQLGPAHRALNKYPAPTGTGCTPVAVESQAATMLSCATRTGVRVWASARVFATPCWLMKAGLHLTESRTIPRRVRARGAAVRTTQAAHILLLRIRGQPCVRSCSGLVPAPRPPATPYTPVSCWVEHGHSSPPDDQAHATQLPDSRRARVECSTRTNHRVSSPSTGAYHNLI
ncbi:hypothetical protein B0H10DRAFT_2184249 [Mycena sp. CBHHK59/15]|nr:hypothetical protein B0H10DRAFT_2184249 [Mycena sp. CBHHK59/15]